MAENFCSVPFAVQVVTGVGEPEPLHTKPLFVICGLFAFSRSIPNEPARKDRFWSITTGLLMLATNFPITALLPIDPTTRFAHGCGSGGHPLSPKGTELPNVIPVTLRASSLMAGALSKMTLMPWDPMLLTVPYCWIVT